VSFSSALFLSLNALVWEEFLAWEEFLPEVVAAGISSEVVAADIEVLGREGGDSGRLPGAGLAG